MAPPTLVHTREDALRRYGHPRECTLKSLTQHECTFKVSETAPPEIICLPFKRLFERCRQEVVVKDAHGHKQVAAKWINFEVTTPETNRDLVTSDAYADDVRDFHRADAGLKALMEGMER
ncbi:Uncharacterized protein ABC855_g1435 [[Candida] zeylanoides]|jgi:inner membrane protease subunit SOM1